MSLSDKRRMEDDHNLLLRNEVTEHGGYFNTPEDFDNKKEKDLFISVKDVGEFIEDILERHSETVEHKSDSKCDYCRMIKRRAGEDLI